EARVGPQAEAAKDVARGGRAAALGRGVAGGQQEQAGGRRERLPSDHDTPPKEGRSPALPGASRKPGAVPRPGPSLGRVLTLFYARLKEVCVANVTSPCGIALFCESSGRRGVRKFLTPA